MEVAIPGFSRYSVDEYGVVTSYARKSPKKLKIKIDKWGYPQVALVSDTGGPAKWLLLHRVVLLAHVGPCPEGKEGRHIDGVPANCRLDNLTWDTHVNNIRDKQVHGTEYNKNKTCCPQGHPYDEENTYYRVDRVGNRGCRACNRDAKRKERALP